MVLTTCCNAVHVPEYVRGYSELELLHSSLWGLPWFLLTGNEEVVTVAAFYRVSFNSNRQASSSILVGGDKPTCVGHLKAILLVSSWL